MLRSYLQSQNDRGVRGVGLGPAQLKILAGIVKPPMRVLTIGRLTARELGSTEQWFDLWLKERFGLNALSLDSSDRDGATIIADLNDSSFMNSDLEGRFDLVIDGGSLEHVANLPAAVQNYHSLLADGGLIFLCNPVNGYAGHGLYQFSPEFYYRVFSPSNGFQPLLGLLEARHPSLFREHGFRSQFFRSPDPALFGKRLGFRGKEKTQMMFIAKKTPQGSPVFDFVQSDYQSDNGNASDSSASGAKRKQIRSTLLQLVAKRLAPRFRRRYRKYYRAVRANRLGVPPLTQVRWGDLPHLLGGAGLNDAQ